MKLLFYCCLLSLLLSCKASYKNYSLYKKYPKQQLQEDYQLLRNILEKKHPSVYWYTSKDSMDKYFEKFYRAIGDSMTEQQFGWKIIAPLIDKIHCGHTSFAMSKEYNKWVQNKRFPSFPLFMKVWNDTMVVTANLNKKDTVLKKGFFIKSINGINNKEIIKTLFEYMPEDGYANNVNYIRLSNNFPYYHRNIFGLSKHYTIRYSDITGREQTINVPLFEIPKDTSKKNKIIPIKKDTIIVVKKSRKQIQLQRINEIRSLVIDSSNNTAIITLNTFATGRLRKFFRQTFRYIKKANITNTIIDLRNNGGGKINLSTLLTRYVTRIPFKVADTAFAVARSLGCYTKYIKEGFLNNIALAFITQKRKDGLYHFTHWEKKVYTPKKNNHFNGNLYILISGSTFSASTLFCNTMKSQQGVQLIGEETGGGWHGNNGIMIPDITLPNTKLRIRLPLFRLVQYNHIPKTGSGVLPDIYISTDYDALVKGIDKKMQVVMEIIKAKN